jgi:two-component system chemotaxis sensor kinase CheA
MCGGDFEMNNQYIDIFLDEAKEHIQKLNDNLLLLGSDQSNYVVDEIFRSAHTLKGMAGTMGFNRIAEITHEMENLLDDIRRAKIDVTPELIDTLLECVDVLELLINGIFEDSSEGELDIKDILNKLRQRNIVVDRNKQYDKKVVAPKRNFNEFEIRLSQEAFRKGFTLYEIHITLDYNCILKSARAFLVFKSLENIGDIIKTYPEVPDIEDEKFNNEFTVYLVTKHAKEKIINSLDLISELDSIQVKQIDPDIFDTLHYDLEDFKTKQSTDVNLNNLVKQVNFSKKTTKTIRVDIGRLDKLMNLVSELIIIKTRLEDLDETSDNQKRKEAIEYLERITSSLHDAVMKVRMVPIENVFNRFPRVVHDLSRELSKKIHLNIEGSETELDRTIIDEIGDPLMHLIRNSIDHGLESPKERIKLDKSEEGTIIIKAYHDGNNVVIQVTDDGRGIDLNIVLKTALQLSLTDEVQAKKLKDTEIAQFLFHPGFSTKNEVTDVSGRGVGLDVVKTKIEALGGSVEIKTKKGVETTFLIRLPLTLAIIQALMVMVGNEKYAIPLSSIKETVIISSVDIKTVQKHEVTLLRDNLIPIIRLNEKLDIQSNVEKRESFTVVIVKKGDGDVGLVVDNLIGQQEIVVKSLGRYLKDIKFIAGATILGDGKVAMLLNELNFYKPHKIEYMR